MRHAAIARVYAKALLELAQEKGELGAVLADLQDLGEMMASGPDLTELLESPRLGFEEKRRVLEKLTADARSSITLRFLLLLLRKHRESALASILAMCAQMRDEEQGIRRGELVSAKPIAEDNRRQLEQSLSEATSASVQLEFETDPGLLAGMVLQLDDKIVDGSLKSRLHQMRQHLVTTDMGKE